MKVSHQSKENTDTHQLEMLQVREGAALQKTKKVTLTIQTLRAALTTLKVHNFSSNYL